MFCSARAGAAQSLAIAARELSGVVRRIGIYSLDRRGSADIRLLQESRIVALLSGFRNRMRAGAQTGSMEHGDGSAVRIAAGGSLSLGEGDKTWRICHGTWGRLRT